jgi:hypothetical protein
MSSEVRVRAAVDRVMRTWSLIKLVPEQSSSGTRSSVTKLLLEHPHLTEDELVAVGLKHLHQPTVQRSSKNATSEWMIPPKTASRPNRF